MNDTTYQPGRPHEAAQMSIPPGLAALPRQIGLFPAFRAALLEDASRQPGLAEGWRGRESEDFGVMLLEMMAYVADVLSFYDQWNANESYLRTATQVAALRRLARLIGYLPRPATAARVTMALALDGRLPVTIPMGTAFRSASFDGEKPQIFVTTAAAALHPLRDQFTLLPQPRTTSTVQNSAITFRRGTVRAKVDDIVLIQSGSTRRARIIDAVAHEDDDGGYPVTRVTFNETVGAFVGVTASTITLLRPTASANVLSFATSTLVYNLVQLDGVHKAIKIGDAVLIKKGDFARWFTVTSVSEHTQIISAASVVNIKDANNNITAKIDAPAVTTKKTQITLDVGVNDNGTVRRMPGDNTWWGADSGANYTVLYGLVGAGVGQGEARDDIRDTDVLRVREKVEYVSSAFRPDTFILRDLNDTAVQVGASLSTNGTLTLDSGSGWEGELLAPVTLYGALIEAERGEIVTGEIIGVGDASIPNQTFALKKFPLTFVNAPSSASTTGVASTVVVRVNHILWREVERFYGRRADETIYTVRTDGDGKATITFGDGVRGARLPSGAVIVADYRFGAGAAAPPANSITQIVTPVKGVSAQRNPIAAYGGSDAESETGLKTYAPKSALMLGRAVSLVDYEATAAATSGVLSAQATWAWSRAQQRPVVQVAYIGAGELGADILERLTMISAVGVPFLVVAATPIALNVYVSIEIDPLYTSDSVITAVTDALAAALLPEVLGVGGMLIRSDVLEIAARIDGVVAPLNVTIDGKPFAAAGMKAQPDEYFAISVMVGGNT